MMTLTKVELAFRLKSYRDVFDMVLVVEESGECVDFVMSNGKLKGEVIVPPTFVHHIQLEKDNPVKKCLDHKAKDTRVTLIEGQVYYLVTEYVEIDGTPYVLLLVNALFKGTMNDVKDYLENTGSMMVKELEQRAIADEEMSVIQGLAGEYDSLRFVDLETEEYSVYNVGQRHGNSKSLRVMNQKFYKEFKEAMKYLCHPEHQERIMAYTEKEKIKEILANQKRYTDRFLCRISSTYYKWMELVFIKMDDVHEEATRVAVGYIDIEEKVKQEQASERTLQAALQAAEKANKSKSEFLFNMSHDIRTPMNAIVGFTELAKRVEDNPEKTKEYLNKITVAEEGLLKLINNVLEMARIENGKLPIHEVALDVSKAIDKTVEIFESLAREKNITLTGHSHIERPYIYEDENFDAQITINIVSNAIKYTNEGGHVDVSLTQFPGDNPEECILEFRCTDDGIGMSDEFIPKAFENFSREYNSTFSKVQGAGLGLAIVHKMLDYVGGTIEIQSKQGEGTTVIIRTHHRYATSEEVTTATMPDEHWFGSAQGKRVLVVEDNKLNLEIAEVMLVDDGFIVETATNGREACDMILKNPGGYYDVVLMDIQMPVMDGYTATGLIRKFTDPLKAGIPIIAVTANAFEEDKKAALAAGMNGHVAKPISLKGLSEALSKFL